MGVCDAIPQAVEDLAVPCEMTLLMVKGPEIGQLVK